MRHLIIGLILTLSIGAVKAQDDALTWHTDLIKAVDISIKEDKPLFLFFTGSDWCGWCKRLQREVFFKDAFQNWADENVVLVELDFPRRKQLDPAVRQQNIKMAQMLGVRGYPTIWFASPTKKESEINFHKLGSIGYKAGGPDIWIKAANSIIASQSN